MEGYFQKSIQNTRFFFAIKCTTNAWSILKSIFVI